MRVVALVLLVLLVPASGLAVEEDDVLFFAPWEGSTDAPLARGSASAQVTDTVRFVEGVRGKAMPAGWRDWRVSSMSGTDAEAFVKNRPAAAGCRNIVNLWHTNVGAFSYLPAKPSEMRAKVGFLHQRGWATVLSYFALDYTQTGTPDYLLMEREWRRNPYLENDFPGGSFASVCNASNWADFLVWAVARTLDETGTDGPANVAISLDGRLAPLRNAAADDPLAKQALYWDDGKLVWSLRDRGVHLAVLGDGPRDPSRAAQPPESDRDHED